MNNEEKPTPRRFVKIALEDFEMGLRDCFANSAMQGLIPMFLGHSSNQDIAKMSYEIADEMLKHREL